MSPAPTENQIYSKVPEAWALTKGSEATRVAVIDSGFDVTPEMPDWMYLRAEGRNTAYDTQDTTEWGSGSRHGSYIAAILNGIGAVNYWGVRRAGRVIPIRTHRDFTESPGGSNPILVVRGLKYAADLAVDVATISLTVIHGRDIRTTVDYALRRGIHIFCSAGNESASALGWGLPGHPGTTAVAAIDRTGTLVEVSNWDAEVAAPTFNPITLISLATSEFTGTSAAAPFAAGIGALCHARNPRATNLQRRDGLHQSCIPIGQDIIHGRVDAEAAVLAMDQYTDISVGRPNAAWTDISGHPLVEAIHTMAWYDVINRMAPGTTFSPDAAVTRIDFAMALEYFGHRMRVAPFEVYPDIVFEDLEPYTFDEPSMAAHRVALAGFFPGASGTLFDPSGTVTRSQAALALADVIEATRGERLTGGSGHFTDLGGDPNAADINALAEAGVIASGGAFRPTDTITRAEVAQLFYDGYQWEVWTRPIDEEALPTYGFRLTVTDANGGQATDVVEVQAEVVNVPPVASFTATPNPVPDAQTPIELDGSGSHDPDGTIVSYLWEQLEGPPGTFSDPSAAVTTFTPDAP